MMHSFEDEAERDAGRAALARERAQEKAGVPSYADLAALFITAQEALDFVSMTSYERDRLREPIREIDNTAEALKACGYKGKEQK